MLDLRWIRQDPESLDKALKRRGEEPAARDILALDERHRQVQTDLQELQNQRNETSKKIGAAKKAGEDAQPLMDEVARLKDRIAELSDEEREAEKELEQRLLQLPNVLADDVPDGADDSENVELRRVGQARRFDVTPQEHYALGEAMGQMDFAASAQMAGSRFVTMQGGIARLQRALGQYFVDTHTRFNGYREVYTPYLVRDRALVGTGQLPKFGEDLFKTTTDHWLIPTAEVTLANMVAEQVVGADALPMRLTALTPCFRSEAGAAGKDTRGMLRQHQFEKCELVSVTKPEESWDELERMTSCAEEVLQALGIPYRVVSLCSGDIGFAARKTYDIEVWLPGQGAYREISSCSNTGDFQARRMNARYRPAAGQKPVPVHTLNGSGVAVGRALIAVMENYQRSDGAIDVPAVLQPYLGGQDVITGDD